MKRRSVLSQGARVTIAVVALYGLVLQAFLSGFVPTGGPLGHGVSDLCAPGKDSGGPAKHDAGGCCTAACISPAAPPPDQMSTALSWPRHVLSGFSFGHDVRPPARGPPLDDHRPRGPPTA